MRAGVAAGLAVGTAAALAAGEVAGRAVRDAYFLSELPPSSLPLAIAASALLALAGTLGLSLWLRHSAPTRVAPLALVASGGVFALLGGVAGTAPRAAAPALYLHMTGLVPVVVTAFWSLVNERFDPYTAKTVVARMAAAGALGGVIGGVAADRAVALLGVPVVLLALGGLSALCGWSTLRVAGGGGAAGTAASTEENERSSFRRAARHPLLRRMAALMLAVAVIETLVDYALKAEAAEAFGSQAALVRFFAIFYTGCGVLGFLIQAALRERFLRRYGLAAAVAMLPASVALAGSIGAVATRLWGFVLARGAETVASIAFFRGGFQLLYTPLPPAARRPAKAWVDVAAGSAGEVLGSVGILALILAVPGLPSRVLLALAAAGSLGALLLVRRLHGSYVRQLGESLRDGRVSLRPEEALDATTSLTLAQSQMRVDRETLLARAREHAARQASGASAPEPVATSRALPDAPESAAEDPSPRWITELASGSKERALRVLKLDALTARGATEARRRRLVAHVVPLLGDEALASAARQFLSDRGLRIVGQLVDELLDPETPAQVRVRLASLLGRAPDARAMAGVWQACADEAFDVRFACARAAARIVLQEAALAPAPEAVHARVRHELELDDALWSSHARRPPAASGDRSVLLSRAALRRVSRSVEHVFTLLSVTHGRELMASALAGVAGDDPMLRGTALEYLESVLPSPLSRRLFARLDAGVAPPSQRTREQIEQQLLLSAANLITDSDSG